MQEQSEILNFLADGFISVDCMELSLSPTDLSFFLAPVSSCCLEAMDILYQCKEILRIQKLRRLASYAGFYAFTTLVTYAYTSNTYVATELHLVTCLQYLPTYYCSYMKIFFALSEHTSGQGLAFRGPISTMHPTLLVLSY
jgi:hypothetical protein